MRTSWLLALVVVTLGAATDAHHSFINYYFEEQVVSFEGKVSELRYRSPHAWVDFSGRGTDGIERAYSAEWVSPARLTRNKIYKDTLKPGDAIVMTASPSRDPSSNHLHVKTIVRPSDGWRWTGQRDPR